MFPIAHPGRLLRRELEARALSANRLALDLGVPSGRITDILNGRRSITADTAVRLGRYFGNSAQFWLDLQSQYGIAVVERERGEGLARRVTPVDAACTTTRGSGGDVPGCGGQSPEMGKEAAAIRQIKPKVLDIIYPDAGNWYASIQSCARPRNAVVLPSRRVVLL